MTEIFWKRSKLFQIIDYSGLCIYDIKDIHPDYRDKSKDIHKMIKLRVHLWKDYYANLLKGIFIVNGGMLIEATSMIPLVGRNVWILFLWAIYKLYLTDNLSSEKNVKNYGHTFEFINF